MKSQAPPTTKKVAAIGVSHIDSHSNEHSETIPIWPVLSMPPPVAVHNKYGTLNDSDDDDRDESDVLKALASITSNVSVASHRESQKARKSKNASSRPLNVTRLNAIARDVRAGKISLPELDLSTDSEYSYVWALGDSGAGCFLG